MAKNVGFWTKERLKELAELSKKKTLHELAKHFGRTPENCTDALTFWQSHRKLKRKTVHRRNYTITVYAPGFAKGYSGGAFDCRGDDDSEE